MTTKKPLPTTKPDMPRVKKPSASNDTSQEEAGEIARKIGESNPNQAVTRL